MATSLEQPRSCTVDRVPVTIEVTHHGLNHSTDDDEDDDNGDYVSSVDVTGDDEVFGQDETDTIDRSHSGMEKTDCSVANNACHANIEQQGSDIAPSMDLVRSPST